MFLNKMKFLIIIIIIIIVITVDDYSLQLYWKGEFGTDVSL